MADTTWDIRWVDETGSTNADVLEAARSGAAAGLVVVADHQTAGRGRRGRSWEAPPNASLMFTVLLRPPAPAAGLATMAVGLAGAAAVEEVTGVVARLKWPNDLVWPGTGAATDRKLAGILAEADWTDPAAPAVAVGMGINVDWAGPMPGDLGATAVALDELTAPDAPPARRHLLDSLLAHLAVTSALDPAALRAAWSDRSATLGRAVRVELGDDEVLEGTASHLTEAGHLVVRTSDGGEREVVAGDVVHVRPGGEGTDQAARPGSSSSS